MRRWTAYSPYKTTRLLICRLSTIARACSGLESSKLNLCGIQSRCRLPPEARMER